MKRGWAVAVLLALYGVVAAFVFTGFAMHRGAVAVIGPYTPAYLVFLVLVLAAVVAPPLIGWAAFRALGARNAAMAGGWVAVVLLAGWVVAEVAYSSFREHRFDPFVQFPGTRFDSIPVEREPGVIRVVAIGGSTTRNYVLDPDRRYPHVLGTLLNENDASPGGYHVLNAGMDWWTTKHSHINYVTYLRAWEPDVAVVMHAINDLYRSFSPPRFAVGDYDPQWAHFYGPAIRGARPRSLVGATLAGTVPWEISRRWYAGWRFRPQDYDLSEYRSLPQFEASMRSLVRTLKADGVEVILVLQPSLYKEEMSRVEQARLWFPDTFCVRYAGPWWRDVPHHASMARALAAYNEVVRKVAAEEGTGLVDAAGLMPRTTEYFADDVHYTELGAAMLARAVANHMVGNDIRAFRD
jgi:lysophospholipase L1-like esterase